MERVITMSEKELTRIAVMQKLESGSMKQAQAADNLGLTTRQIKRLWKIYKTQGAEGLISKKRGARGLIHLHKEKFRSNR